MMFCQRCGSPMNEGQAFCGKCGAAAPSQLSTAESVTSITPEITVPEGDAFSALIPEEAPQAKKRVWPKIVIPIVALVLVATLAVGAYFMFFALSEEDVIGKWKMEVDLGELMDVDFGELAEGLSVNKDGENIFEGLYGETVIIYYEFKKDHTLVLSLDEESYLSAAKKAFKSRYGDGLNQNNITITEEQYIEFLENYIESYNSFIAQKMADDGPTWSFKDGKVYLGDDTSVWYELDGNTMTAVADREQVEQNANTFEQAEVLLGFVDLFKLTRVD